MTPLWLLWDAPATVVVPREIHVRGRDDTAIHVRGRDDTAIHVRGRDDTAIHVRGSLTMPRVHDIEFAQGEDIAIIIDDLDLTGETIVATIRDGGTGEVIAQATADIDDDGIATIVFDAAATGDVPAGQDDGLTELTHRWDAARTTPGKAAVLVRGAVACYASPTLQAN